MNDKASPLIERSDNQCMGCQAGWPLENGKHKVVGGYPGELVGCTAEHYSGTSSDHPSGSGRTTDDKQLHELVMDLRVASGDPANLHRRFFDILKPKFDAHNAELTAERKRTKQAFSDYGDACLKLQAEVQRREQQEKYAHDLFAQCRATEQRLLSALAAIEKAKEKLTRVDACHTLDTYDTDQAYDAFRTIDLSSLHRHDAEVRKPLVEALERLRLIETPELKSIIDDALAKAKAIKYYGA